MRYYKYTPKNKKESDLIKSEFEIINIPNESNNKISFSLSKNKIRKIKLASLSGNKKNIRLKKIISNSESFIDIHYLFEDMLVKELSNAIDKKIMSELIKLN